MHMGCSVSTQFFWKIGFRHPDWKLVDGRLVYIGLDDDDHDDYVRQPEINLDADKTLTSL